MGSRGVHIGVAVGPSEIWVLLELLWIIGVREGVGLLVPEHHEVCEEEDKLRSYRDTRKRPVCESESECLSVQGS